MKSLILLLAILCTLSATTSAADKPKRLFLLIGQSNMSGRAPIGDADKDPIKNTFLLDAEGKWQPAANPLNQFSSIRKGLGMQKVSIGYGFAKAISKDTKEPIGLIVNAKGGSNIDEWTKDSKFFKEAMRRVEQAEKDGVKLEAVLWHQGESNEKDDQYDKKLATLIEDLRNATGNKDLPFVAGEVREGTAVNKFITELPKKVKHTAVASSKGLKTYDRWHFDRDSIIKLGERYAEAYLSIKE
jgi:glycerophosphoryl diester phosphodiesterase